MPKEEDQHPHNNDVFLDLELDHLGSDGAALSPTPSQLSALGGTAFPNQTQKLQNEWEPATPALGTKLKVFGAFFNPIPFRPVKTLDFQKHEFFLKHLGLWDFIHLDYDFELRADLLQQLVLNFDPKAGFSTVDGISIEISRMAIAGALKLPVQQVEIDTPLEVRDLESIEFVEEFVMNWILLHEDAWMMPEEVLEWMGFIREGKLHEVDWAGLMWFMVNRELLQVREAGNCYYASHLDCLIEFQRPGLFEERAMVEGHGKGEQDMGYAKAIQLDDDDDDDEQDVVDVKMIRLDDDDDGDSDDNGDRYSDNDHDAFNVDDNIGGLEDQNNGLQLELGKIESGEVGGVDVMNLQECKEVEPEYWPLNGRTGSGEHSLQQCNRNEICRIGFQSERKAEVGKENYDISMKCGPIEGFASGNWDKKFIATKNLHCNPPIYIPDHSTEEPIASRTDTCANVGNLFMFNNSLKRQFEHGDEIDHLCLNYYNKRMRNDDSSDPNLQDFDFCMKQIQTWMDKARMAYVAREEACRTAKTNEQVLLKTLEQQESMIKHLERTKHEDNHKREVEVYHLTRELHFMGNLVDGYKSALKKTQRLFSEYRECCPQPEEPLYRDVVRTGGVVLSNDELGNQAS